MTATIFLSVGCAALLPRKCHTGGDTRPREREMLRRYHDPSRKGAFLVYTPKGKDWHPHGAPVLILQEMPALSPAILALGLRVADAGYAVYVPLLWGGEMEDAHSTGVFLKHAFGLSNDPRWRAMSEKADRPVVHELTDLCKNFILKEHPGQRIGVIGNCVTGILPAALAANVPGVVAPVVCQPTLPLVTLEWENIPSGLSPDETAALRYRIHCEPTFQLLGVRFERDPVSPAGRFVTLSRDFGDRFINGQIPVEIYHGRDAMPVDCHAVLTEGYEHATACGRARSVDHAWQECLDFLHAKLATDGPRLYRFRGY